jgi:ribosomal protein S18 acetylase RimI-like enzyme
VNTDVLIRTAVASDADPIAAIYLASRSMQHAFAPMTVNEVAAVRSRLQERRARVAVSVHAAENTPLGFCAVSHHESAAWIDELYLLPCLAGKGIGSLLLEHVLHGSAGPVRLYTFEANAGARRFYERHGFTAMSIVGADPSCRYVLYGLNCASSTEPRTAKCWA